MFIFKSFLANGRKRVMIQAPPNTQRINTQKSFRANDSTRIGVCHFTYASGLPPERDDDEVFSQPASNSFLAHLPTLLAELPQCIYHVYLPPFYHCAIKWLSHYIHQTHHYYNYIIRSLELWLNFQKKMEKYICYRKIEKIFFSKQ